jgi:hypothetical protein
MISTIRPGHAGTAPDAADAGLRGRTYAVPFEHVWQAALRLAGARLRGWSVRSADDHDGVIEVVTRGLAGALHDVTIRITLDEDAQTRVDASAVAHEPRTDFGRARRRLLRFFKALDRAVAGAHRRAAARTR